MRIFISFIALLFFLPSCLLFAEDKVPEPTPTSPKTENNNKKEALALEASKFSDFFRSQSKNGFKGVILGNLISVEKDYLYVKPKESELGRMFVYLDSKTLYSKMSNGKLQNGKKEEVLEGERVAIRVVMKDGLVLADEVFMVEGDFDPRNRYRKRVIAKKKPKEGEEKKEGEAKEKDKAKEKPKSDPNATTDEEGGAAAKAPKKKGGH